jgi:oligoendopeptidase F
MDPRYTWNAESVFASPAAWKTELDSVLAALPGIKKYQGRLAESPAVLAEALKAVNELVVRASRVFVYAGFAHSVDTGDQSAAAMDGQAQGMLAQVSAIVSFVNPELIAAGEKKLRRWVKDEDTLKIYAQFIDNLFRRQAHVRSAEVEELLGMSSELLSGPYTTATMLANADFRFKPATDSQGQPVEVTEGLLSKILASPDRAARQSAWENYMDEFLAHRNALASNLGNAIKGDVFLSRARKFDSALEASLFEINIPVEVFHNLLATFQKNLPVWQRYFKIRRKALGLKELAPYDMWAPIAPQKVKIPYLKAVDLICEGLAPMGTDYVATLRKGCLEDRWVDVYPNQGKRTGAFSWGAQGTHPFIMMSYNDEIFSLSTLAHELGHSMHSHLTWKNQPPVYSDYSLFVAEVASNFHQAMVRASLLKNSKDPNFQIAVIEEAMSNFYRYFFIMPTLARFELETHQRIERGDGLTADSMIDLMADLFSEGYGREVKVDRQRVGITWATFQHLFMNFYVYAYATGISGAHALSGRILKGEAGAVEDYLGFLRSGSSVYPLDVLKKAGVDLTTPQPVEETFAVMAGYVDRLESLVKKL